MSSNLVANLIKRLFWLYRSAFSPYLPGTCRFSPTCSQYSEEAINQFGLLKGGRMTLGRLARCHPFSEGGFDPVATNYGKHKKALKGVDTLQTGTADVF